MVKLVPMDEEAYSRYMGWSIKNYADEKVKAGNWPLDGSLERSREEFNKLLKDGLRTENNYLYTAMDGDRDVLIHHYIIDPDSIIHTIMLHYCYP